MAAPPGSEILDAGTPWAGHRRPRSRRQSQQAVSAEPGSRPFPQVVAGWRSVPASARSWVLDRTAVGDL